MPGFGTTLTRIEDVQALIQASVRESQALEYKTATNQFSDREKGEISKDVSAMANSGGGTIIYGVSTDPVDKTRPAAIEPIAIVNVETFDRVVNSQIRPPILGLSKKVLPVDNPRVMIVDVPESENPPHQSLYDSKYYRRSGVETRPMEHDLVALYFGRITGPILSLEFGCSGQFNAFSGDPLFSNEVSLRVLVMNSGKRVGRYVSVILTIPPMEQVRASGFGLHGWQNIDDLQVGSQGRQFNSDIGVFHPKLRTRIGDVRLSVSRDYLQEHPADPLIGWVIYADRMEPQNGIVSLRSLGLV